MSDHREVIQRRSSLVRFRTRPKSGRIPPEWVAGISRNQWPLSPEIAGRIRPEYAIVDNHTRESLAIHVAQRIRCCDVVEVLERIVKDHGKPQTIRVDNGPEFISKDVDLWAYWNHVTLDFSRPGKPTDNAYIESFNGRFRQECLNEHWFMSFEDAREKVESWRRDYNENRPHSSLDNATPEEFAALAESRKAKLERNLEMVQNGLTNSKSC